MGNRAVFVKGGFAPLFLRFCHRLSLAAALSLSSQGYAEEIKLFEARYKGSFQGVKIEMSRKLLQLEGGSYRLQSDTNNLFASIRESSTFVVTRAVFEPLHYQHHRKVFGTRESENITFDWKNTQAHYTSRRKPERNATHTLTPGIGDPAIYQLQLQRDAYFGIKEVSYRFVKNNAIKTYDFKRIGEKTFDFGKDQYSAEVYVRSNSQTSRTEIWLAPKLNYQIAFLKHVDDEGGKYQVQLSHYSAHSAALIDFYKNKSSKK